MPGIGEDSQGVRDGLTRFTKPVTGAYYFVPSIESLRPFAGVRVDEPE